MRYAESMGGIITNIHYLYGHKYPLISIIYMAIDTFQIKLLLFDTLSCVFQICHILSHIVTNVPYLNTAYGEGKLVLRSGNGVEKVGNFILTKVWEPWSYLRMAISMLKIRRPLGRLIFNMGIAIPGKTVFLIETAPRMQGKCVI